MVWLVIYIVYNESGEIIKKQMGNFLGGNCKDVIRKVCRIHNLRYPKNKEDECKVLFTSRDQKREGRHLIHSISVGSIDELIAL